MDLWDDVFEFEILSPLVFPAGGPAAAAPGSGAAAVTPPPPPLEGCDAVAEAAAAAGAYDFRGRYTYVPYARVLQQCASRAEGNVKGLKIRRDRLGYNNPMFAAGNTPAGRVIFHKNGGLSHGYKFYWDARKGELGPYGTTYVTKLRRRCCSSEPPPAPTQKQPLTSIASQVPRGHRRPHRQQAGLPAHAQRQRPRQNLRPPGHPAPPGRVQCARQRRAHSSAQFHQHQVQVAGQAPRVHPEPLAPRGARRAGGRGPRAAPSARVLIGNGKVLRGGVLRCAEICWR